MGTGETYLQRFVEPLDRVLFDTCRAYHVVPHGGGGGDIQSFDGALYSVLQPTVPFYKIELMFLLARILLERFTHFPCV